MARGGWLDDPVVEDDPSWILHMNDGTTIVDADVSVSEDDYRRMWQGYICPGCYAVCDAPFDRPCDGRGGRGYYCLVFGDEHVTPEMWHRYMDARFGGHKWIGPSRETVARLNEPSDSRIWLPGDD